MHCAMHARDCGAATIDQSKSTILTVRITDQLIGKKVYSVAYESETRRILTFVHVGIVLATFRNSLNKISLIEYTLALSDSFEFIGAI